LALSKKIECTQDKFLLVIILSLNLINCSFLIFFAQELPVMLAICSALAIILSNLIQKTASHYFFNIIPSYYVLCKIQGNTLINIITYALIVFTALSLVVSCVMIAIITYVSVMERVKEIGVIRSLGGRKKDVSNLFNAETFIIGLSSGVFGVGFTYLLQLIANLIIGKLTGIYTIADLALNDAITMIDELEKETNKCSTLQMA
jgi:hypothetical protein